MRAEDHWIAPLRSHRYLSTALHGEEELDSPYRRDTPRPFRIGVDFDSYRASGRVVDALFAALTEADDVQMLRFSDEGPPTGLMADDWGAVEGWVRYGFPDPGDFVGLSSGTMRVGGQSTRFIIRSSGLDFANREWRQGPYAHLGEEEAKDRTSKALVLAQAAYHANCHALISDRAFYDHEPSRLLVAARVTSIEGAVSMISLHQRLANRYRPFQLPGFRRLTDASGYFRGVSSVILDRYPHIPVGASKDGGQTTDSIVASRNRFAKALRARDEVLRLLTHHPTEGVCRLLADEIEDVVVAMMGATDNLAQAFRHHFGLGIDIEQCTWSNDSFRTIVKRRVGASATRWVYGHNRSGAAFDLLRHIRNSIHGRSPEVVSMRNPEDHAPGRFYLTLPLTMKTSELRAAVLLLGGEWYPGMGEPGQVGHLPEAVMDLLIAETATLLNGLVNEMIRSTGEAQNTTRSRVTADEREQLSLQMGLPITMFEDTGSSSPVALPSRSMRPIN